MLRFIFSMLVVLWANAGFAQDSGPTDTMTAAFAAADDGDWSAAYALAATEGRIALDLITWKRLRAGEGDFDEYPVFLSARANWPGLDRIRLQGEKQIPSNADIQSVLRYFDGQEVNSGEGAAAYARALRAEGRGEEADAMVVHLWKTEGLTEDGFNTLIMAEPDVLLPYHMERAEGLLWRWRTEDAARLLPYLDEGQQALIRARIGYITKASDITERLALVPDRYKEDPGLLYDRFNWLADRGDWTDATALLEERSTSEDALVHPWRWGSWRRILARWQMRAGNPSRAYSIAQAHYLSPDDSSFADLEWLSGYLALRYLDDSELALSHFEAFRNAVETPISLGRAGYWIGRAHEEMGDDGAATAAYLEGAQYQTSYYGLLSAEKLGAVYDPDLAGSDTRDDWQDASFLTDDRFQAGMLLLSGGERGEAVLFMADLAKTLPENQIAPLGQVLMDIDEPFYALLVAKAAVRRGLLLQNIYFPLHDLAQMDWTVETALALAISRQESEFRTDAGSSVGALGLMQLMPGTAGDMAREVGLPYSRARLTTDWEYNATLGTEYLRYLQETYGGSPVLIGVGYNAGPGRVNNWIEQNGDPRGADVDVVDWIEHIPFRETRNYVMRVSEGVAVYRARLNGSIGTDSFTDLLKGQDPLALPARPERFAAPEQSLRPALRPESLVTSPAAAAPVSE